MDEQPLPQPQQQPSALNFWLSIFVPPVVALGLAFGFPLVFKAGSYDNYDTSLFLAVPMLQGILCGIIQQFPGSISRARYWNTQHYGMLVTFFALLFTLREGMICIIMAAPLLMPAFYLGAFIPLWMFKGQQRVSVTFAVIPIAIVAGMRLTGAPETYVSTSTETVFNTNSNQLFPLAQSLDSIESNGYWLFTMGVARPTSTQTFADGTRVCRLTTGDMPEFVSMNVRNKVFEFTVTETPATMKELNPFGEVDAPHLESHFEVIKGKFEFDALPGNRTRVRATSYYRHRLGPAWYWNLWTDDIVHQIHHSVFDEMGRRVN